MSRLFILFAVCAVGCSGRALAPGADGGSAGICDQRSLPECERDSRCVLRPGCCDPNEIVCAAAGSPKPVCHCEAGCAGLDETACQNDPTCRADYCSECSCTQSYAGCTRPSDPPTECPGFGCPTPLCQCDGLSESACLAAAPSQGCTAFYCADCNGGQFFSGCLGPSEGAGACPAGCVETSCRKDKDCPNGGLCLTPPQSGACGGDFCPMGPACKSNSDCGKSQVCAADPCCPNSGKACLSGCLNGCPAGQSCGANGLCAETPCKSDDDCNPPCTGPLNCQIDFCVDGFCYPSLGTCGPPPV